MFFNGGTELLVLKEVYASTQTSYHDLLVRTPGLSLAELRYYEALLTDQAGDVIRYMLNDTLHNQLDSIAAWSLRLNTPAGDWYAADVYRNMGQDATATSVVNAIGTRYSGLIDVPKYNTQKTLFGLISSAQLCLTPSSSLTSYTTGSGYVRSVATAFQVSRGEYHDPYFWVGSPSFQSGLEETSTKTDLMLTVYPNPTSGIVTVDLGMDAVVLGLLTIYNAQGKSIHSQKLHNDQRTLQLDLSDQTSGRYYIIMSCNDGKMLKGSFMLIK